MTMDIDFRAYIEQTLNNLSDRVEALESALVQLPAVEYEPDPSRVPGVRIVPAPAPSPVMEVPPNG
jgi:hypothetical protein